MKDKSWSDVDLFLAYSSAQRPAFIQYNMNRFDSVGLISGFVLAHARIFFYRYDPDVLGS